MLNVMEADQSLGEVNATISNNDQQEHFHLPITSMNHLDNSIDEETADLPDFDYHIDHVDPLGHVVDPGPVVSHHELPAPYGCRSLATKTCSKVPMRVAKKVPYEKCKTVASVECGVVLKQVPDLACYPEAYEDCRDVAREVPYIDMEEQCEELTFDECVEVSICIQ